MAFPVNGVLDDFNRANETPLSGGGNWNALNNNNQLNLVGNAVQGVAAVNRHSAWVATTFGPGYEAFITANVIPAVNGSFFVTVGVVDTGTAGWDGFLFQWVNVAGGSYRLQRVRNGVNTGFGVDVAAGMLAGDKLGIELTNGVVTGYRFTAGAWVSVSSAAVPQAIPPRLLALLHVGEVTQSPVTGNIGCGGFAATWSLDDFGGGSLPT